MDNTFKCCICGKNVKGIGNNPYPVTKGENDKCCNACNAVFVIPDRFRKIIGGKYERK